MLLRRCLHHRQLQHPATETRGVEADVAVCELDRRQPALPTGEANRRPTVLAARIRRQSDLTGLDGLGAMRRGPAPLGSVRTGMDDRHD
jgi:hypothetical protein